MNKKFFLAVGLLAGTILGAGIFSLPYVVGWLGVPLGFSYLALFALVYFSIHLMYARLILKVGPGHNFLSLTEEFLPGKLKFLSDIAILGELVLTLTIYLILAPVFIRTIFNINAPTALLFFWAVGTAFIFVKLKWLGLVEILGVLSILALVLIIFFPVASNLSGLPLSPRSSGWMFWLLPFGPLLFAFSGRPAVSKMIEVYRSADSDFSINKAIFLGTFLPALLYAGFVAAVLVLNPAVGPDMFGALNFPPFLLGILGFLGLVSIWTSYFMIGLNLKEILRQDLRWNKFLSGITVIFLPLIFYVLGFQNFLETIGIVGGVFLALEGIFITAMWRKVFRENKLRVASLILYLIFFAAIAYEVVKYVS
ncbi:MAG: aromatic amino acid transport family protein [Minisyncoccia bacterium]